MQQGQPTATLDSREQFILQLDVGVFGAAYRTVFGFMLLPVYEFLVGPGGPVYAFVAFLLMALFLLKLSISILRKPVRMSPVLREALDVRRRTAKYYDSFQWRKLLWIGIGLTAYILLMGPYPIGYLLVAFFCIAGGAAGTVIWRRIEADEMLPKPVPRKLKQPK